MDLTVYTPEGSFGSGKLLTMAGRHPRRKTHALQTVGVGVAASAALAAGAALVLAGGRTVPLVELDGSDASRAAMLDAASELGAFRIRAAPFLSAADLELALGESAELFASSEDEKRSWPVVRFSGDFAPIARGYIPFGGESGVGSRFFEVKEGFAYSHESGCAASQGGLAFCNAWPAGRGAFRDAALQLLNGSFAAARKTAEQLAIALGGSAASADAVVASLDAGLPSSVLRLFHYHSRHHCRETGRSECRARGPLEEIGSSPHTDWHALTVIAEGARSPRAGWLRTAVRDWLGAPTGLQIRARGSERWRSVGARPGELIVIVGDLLSLGSAGALHSPVHRVLLPALSGSTRTSFTLFAYPRGSDTIATWARLLAPAAGRSPPDIEALLAATRECAGSGEWNTLLAQSGADARADEPFERILSRKWRGVSTAGAVRSGASGARGAV